MSLPIADALDAFAESIADALELPATCDPALVTAPCVFVGVPTIVGRTMGAVILDVPVSLIAKGTGDVLARNYLLEHVQAFLDATGAKVATPQPFTSTDVNYPSMKSTATITVRSTSP